MSIGYVSYNGDDVSYRVGEVCNANDSKHRGLSINKFKVYRSLEECVMKEKNHYKNSQFMIVTVPDNCYPKNSLICECMVIRVDFLINKKAALNYSSKRYNIKSDTSIFCTGCQFSPSPSCGECPVWKNNH